MPQPPLGSLRSPATHTAVGICLADPITLPRSRSAFGPNDAITPACSASSRSTARRLGADLPAASPAAVRSNPSTIAASNPKLAAIPKIVPQICRSRSVGSQSTSTAAGALNSSHALPTISALNAAASAIITGRTISRPGRPATNVSTIDRSRNVGFTSPISPNALAQKHDARNTFPPGPVRGTVPPASYPLFRIDRSTPNPPLKNFSASSKANMIRPSNSAISRKHAAAVPSATTSPF